MKRHWIIRSVFVGLLSLCLAGWAGSYFRGGIMSCTGYDLWIVRAGAGEIAFQHWPDYRMKYGWRGEPMWHCALPPPPPNGIVDALARAGDYTTRANFLGFFYLGKDTYQPGLQVVGIPFWFLALLFALAALVVWRKTGKGRMQAAFPVQTASSKCSTSE